MKEQTDIVERALAHYRSIFNGRTYSVGQELRYDEVLVGEIERLRDRIEELHKVHSKQLTDFHEYFYGSAKTVGKLSAAEAAVDAARSIVARAEPFIDSNKRGIDGITFGVLCEAIDSYDSDEEK